MTVKSFLPLIVPMHTWEWPEHPWERTHINYAGPFMGKIFCWSLMPTLDGWRMKQ